MHLAIDERRSKAEVATRKLHFTRYAPPGHSLYMCSYINAKWRRKALLSILSIIHKGEVKILLVAHFKFI